LREERTAIYPVVGQTPSPYINNNNFTLAGLYDLAVAYDFYFNVSITHILCGNIGMKAVLN